MAVQVRAADADIPMGMTQIEDGDHKVLFVRDDKGLRAFEAACPHYGAPLAKGRLCGRTLYCPWHKAAFDIGDGRLVQPPALRGLKQYPAHREGGSIVATLEPMIAARRPAQGATKTFVIVGTGAAAVAAVMTLRHEGFAGKIVMIGKEANPPYDRTALSKSFLAKKTKASETYLEEDFYESHGVQQVNGPAARIDPSAKRVDLQNGESLSGDALLIATGSAAFVPSITGANLANVVTLRSLADAVALSDLADPKKNAAIVGGGFIALEAAASLTKRGLVATVISPEWLPLAARFGDEVARAIKAFHEGNGVRFRSGKVAALEGNGAVSAVRLDGGDFIKTDLVLIGAGAKPQTDAIVAPKRDDGGIEVGADLQLAPDVWLAGDIAAFPEAHSGTIARIEHWRLAEQEGRHAALGMLGHRMPFTEAPFFWSNQGAKRLDYAGYTPSWDEIVTIGDVTKLDFIAYYIKGGKPLAACAIGRSDEIIAFLHLLSENRLPDRDKLANVSLKEMA